jgi:hypothetical protein
LREDFTRFGAKANTSAKFDQVGGLGAESDGLQALVEDRFLRNTTDKLLAASLGLVKAEGAGASA